MKFLRHSIKIAVISGLVSQLMMAAFMVSMVLDRAGLKSAQNNFYSAFAQTLKQPKSGFSLCLSDDGSLDSLEDCLICDALIGTHLLTPPVVASFGAIAQPISTIVPVPAVLYTQSQRSVYGIRGPPVLS